MMYSDWDELFLNNPSEDVMLSICNLEKSDFGRFRDVHFEKHKSNGKYKLVVCTRDGGSNRVCYKQHENPFKDVDRCMKCSGCNMITIKSHTLYSHDEDDSFDKTYAYIHFKIPEKFYNMIEELMSSKNSDKKWIKHIKKIRS